MSLITVLLFAGPAQAQWGRQAPADITQVEVKELSNAVRVTIRANGIINLNPGAFWDTAFQQDGESWGPAAVRRVPFRLTNCRSRVGAFYNVSRYPVSHVELSVSPDDPLGIGVDVAIVLYRDATVMGFRFGDDRSGGWQYEGLGYDVSTSPDKRSIIFTVMSDRFPAKPVERVQPGPDRPEQLSVEVVEGKVAATAQYVPLRRLLDTLASRTGVRILLEDGVERTVSLHLDGVSLQELLRALVATYGLSLSPINGEWAVGEGMVTGPANYFPSETRRFPLRYLAPADAVDLLPNFLLAYVHPDPEGNVLVASGPDSMLDKIGADLARLDVAPPQIEVQAIAVEFTSVDDLQAALDVNTTSGKARISVVPSTGSITFRALATQVADVRAHLKALETRQVLRLRAEPRMTVLSGRTATLFVGQQRYITVYRRSGRGMRGEIRSLPVGVSLEVTPWTGGGAITLQVNPSVTLVEELDPRTRMPVLGVRRAVATARIQAGETILISGLGLAQQDRRRGKIPILGDLPLVGSLFRTYRRYQTDTDLAVFVTARVV